MSFVEKKANVWFWNAGLKFLRDSITLFSFSNNKYNMIKIYRYFLLNLTLYNFVSWRRDWLLKESCNCMTHNILDLYYITNSKGKQNISGVQKIYCYENSIFRQISIICNCIWFWFAFVQWYQLHQDSCHSLSKVFFYKIVLVTLLLVVVIFCIDVWLKVSCLKAWRQFNNFCHWDI